MLATWKAWKDSERGETLINNAFAADPKHATQESVFFFKRLFIDFVHRGREWKQSKKITHAHSKVLLHNRSWIGTKVCMYARLDFAEADVEYSTFERATFYTMYQRLFPCRLTENYRPISSKQRCGLNFSISLRGKNRTTSDVHFFAEGMRSFAASKINVGVVPLSRHSMSMRRLCRGKKRI